jgi:hypothetical protein
MKLVLRDDALVDGVAAINKQAIRTNADSDVLKKAPKPSTKLDKTQLQAFKRS